MQGFLIMVVFFILIIVIGNRLEPKKYKPIESAPPPAPMEYDIVQHSNGRFSPTYQGKYCFLTTTDSAITISTPHRWVMFESKKEAREYLERWKIMKGLGNPKSVGL